MLQCLASQFINIFNHLPFIRVYADLQSLRASESPPATIPSAVMVTPYRPDVVIHNTATSSIALLKLTCPLDSSHHLQSARSRKQSKVEYQQFLAKLDHLNIYYVYETLKVSVLGHYYLFSIKNLWNLIFYSPGYISVKRNHTAAAGWCFTEMYCGIPENIYGEGLLRVVSIPGLICIYMCWYM